MFTLHHQQLFLLLGLEWSWAAFTFCSVLSLLSRIAPATHSSVCVMYSLTDKGIKKAILGLTLSGKWTVSFRVLPASWRPCQKHQASSPHSWVKVIMAETKTELISVPGERVHSSITLKCQTLKRRKKRKLNYAEVVIWCVDYSGFFSLLSPSSGTSP